MRDKVFEIFDLHGSFAIDRKGSRFEIIVDDTVECAGWDVTAEQLRKIAEGIRTTLQKGEK